MFLRKPNKEKVAGQQGRHPFKRLLAAVGTLLLNNWKQLASSLALLVMLGITVWSVQQAQWISPQPSLMTVLVLAIIAGWLLATSRLPAVASYPLAIVLGAGIVLWQLTSLTGETGITASLARLAKDFQSWWQAADAKEPSQETIQVAVAFAYLTWVVGFVSTWFVMRRQNPWVAVSLGGAALLVNLTNLPDKAFIFFFFYLVAALLFIAQTTALKGYSWSSKQWTGSRQNGVKYLLASVLCLSTVAVSLAWLTPEVRVYSIESLVQAKMPFRDETESYWQSFFGSVRANKPTLVHGQEGALRFGGSLELSSQVLFLVNTERPRYWRTQTYDIYAPRGWQASPTTDEALGLGGAQPKAAPSGSYTRLTYTVVPEVYTDVLLTTGEVTSTSIPAVAKTLTPVVFNIRLAGFAGNSLLPPDLASLASRLRADLAGKPTSDSELAQRLPDTLKLVSIRRSGEQVSDIRVTRTGSAAEDIVTLTSLRSLEPGKRYTATAQFPNAGPADLLKGGEDYPQRITDRYLQLSPAFPQRVRQLAATVTKDARTPYDKAVAIREYLSQITYSLVINAPPPDADGVEYFLFTEKAGYCTYFASAMAVMLRSVGVPARLSVGYMPGVWEEDSQSYVIRDLDYHAWPEVYFPGYGWVEFEATPGRSLDDSVADFLAEEEFLDEELLVDPSQDLDSSVTSAETLRWALLGFVALALVLGLGAYRRLLSTTGLGTASAIYARLCLLASLVRLGNKPQQTPFEYSTRLSATLPQKSGAINNIVQAYVASQYSPHKALNPSEKGSLRESWRQVRNALLKRLFGIK